MIVSAAAARQRKALRRYQQEILRGSPETAVGTYAYLTAVPIPEGGFRFAPDRRLMAPLATFNGGRRRLFGSSVNGDYRQSTYGSPSKYADLTRSSTGTGVIGDPYNRTQALSAPVGGDVVGFFETGSSALEYNTTNDDNDPVMKFAANGTAPSPIVGVSKYNAIGLLISGGRAGLESSSNRTEPKHNGSAPGISGGSGTGTGCPLFGSTGQNHTWDGFYEDQATSYMKEDSGNIRDESSTNFKMYNFVIKGRTHTIASNPVIWRPNSSTGTVLSNFAWYDFRNDATGSNTPQEALGSDAYGAQNFLLEKFLIENITGVNASVEMDGVGLFLKGAPGGVENYGTIRYGIIKDCGNSIRLNATHTSINTYLEYLLLRGWHMAAICFGNEGPGCSNIKMDRITTVTGTNTGNYHGPFYNKEGNTSNRTGNAFTNSMLDGLLAGHIDDSGELLTNHIVFSNNASYRETSAFSAAFNGTPYSAVNTWEGATGGSNNSHQTTECFNNRGSGDFSVTGTAATRGVGSTPVGCQNSPVQPGYS